MLRFAVFFSFLTSAAFADSYAVGDTFDDPMVIAQEAFAGFPPEEEGRPGIEVSTTIDFFGVLTIVVAQTGFADDSVAGERNQYVLQQEDGTWTLAYHRTDYLCRRGLNTVTWQGDLCP